MALTVSQVILWFIKIELKQTFLQCLLLFLRSTLLLNSSKHNWWRFFCFSKISIALKFFTAPWASAEIFPGGQRRHFAYPFSGCERCNTNAPSQVALPFLHYKENSPRKHSLHSHFLKSYSGGAVFDMRKGTFCHPLQLLLNWGIVQYHYYCQLQTTESEFELSTTAFVVLALVCAGWTSLFKIYLVWNVFYTLAIRNDFSFHTLLNIRFSSTFQK